MRCITGNPLKKGCKDRKKSYPFQQRRYHSLHTCLQDKQWFLKLQHSQHHFSHSSSQIHLVVEMTIFFFFFFPIWLRPVSKQISPSFITESSSISWSKGSAKIRLLHPPRDWEIEALASLISKKWFLGPYKIYFWVLKSEAYLALRRFVYISWDWERISKLSKVNALSVEHLLKQGELSFYNLYLPLLGKVHSYSWERSVLLYSIN